MSTPAVINIFVWMVYSVYVLSKSTTAAIPFTEHIHYRISAKVSVPALLEPTDFCVSIIMFVSELVVRLIAVISTINTISNENNQNVQPSTKVCTISILTYATVCYILPLLGYLRHAVSKPVRSERKSRTVIFWSGRTRGCF